MCVNDPAKLNKQKTPDLSGEERGLYQVVASQQTYKDSQSDQWKDDAPASPNTGDHQQSLHPGLEGLTT